MSPASVAAACPVGRDPRRSRSSRRANSWRSPPACRIAPSTPPPPMSPLLAALTTASTFCSVMSPRTSTISMPSAAVELVRIRPDAPRLGQRRQSGHLRVSQLDVEHVDVLRDPLLVRRLRDDDATELDVPAQHDLRGGLVVFLRDAGHDRIVEQPVAAPERAPRLGDDAVPVVELARLLLREPRVQLDLVDRGHHRRLAEQALEVRHGEVRHPDRAHPPVGIEPLERSPRVDVEVALRSGPVDEVEVDDVETEALLAVVERAQRRVVTVV